MALASRKKRVLFLVPAFTEGSGGAEQLTATILRHLDRSGLECHLAMLQSGTEFLKGLPEEVVLHHLDVTRMRYAIPGILRLLRTIRPDTIISTVAYLNVMVILARRLFSRRTPLVVVEVTTPSAFIARDVGSPRLWKFFYRRLYPRADRIVCLSDSIRKEFQERFHVPAEKLVRIYTAVDGVAVRDAAQAVANPLSGEGPNLVAAGRLRHEKGFDLLIDAMVHVHRQVPQARLTILGDGPEQEALKQQVRDLDLSSAVDLVGFQQHHWAYMAHADLVVLPSRVEGMPNVLLEALALDVPVVATECVETMRELQALDDRILLAEPENPSSLAQAIVSVLQQPKALRSFDHASNGRLRLFDPVEIAAQYRKLL